MNSYNIGTPLRGLFSDFPAELSFGRVGPTPWRGRFRSHIDQRGPTMGATRVGNEQKCPKQNMLPSPRPARAKSLCWSLTTEETRRPEASGPDASYMLADTPSPVPLQPRASVDDDPKNVRPLVTLHSGIEVAADFGVRVFAFVAIYCSLRSLILS